MTDRGYFALYRGTLDHPIFKKERYTEAQAWVWMLEQASYRPRRQMIGGKMLCLDRGQFSHALRFMAAKFQWSEPKVRRFLTRLKTDAMIDAASDAGQLVVTICNYSRLQPDISEIDAANDALTDAAATQERRATDAGATQSKERKKERREEINTPSLRSGVAGQGELIPSDSNLPAPREISPRRKTEKKLAKEKKIPWPDDFDLNGDMHRYAEEAGIAFNAIHDLWERFKAHHIKNGNCWAGLRGWQMAWQGWVRNEIKFDKERREKNGGGRPARAGYDPIEYARQRIEQLNTIEEESALWSKTTN